MSRTMGDAEGAVHGALPLILPFIGEFGDGNGIVGRNASFLCCEILSEDLAPPLTVASTERPPPAGRGPRCCPPTTSCLARDTGAPLDWDWDRTGIGTGLGLGQD
eukprot:Polyplicarium_translucidae@DN1786_c0_g2_i2.p3